MPSETPTLLIVENDRRFQETLRVEFQERGYNVLTACSLSEVRLISEKALRFATVDLRLDTESGIPVVEHLRSKYPECRIVVLTGYGSIATAVEAVKRGASQYMTKPVQIERLEKLLWTDAPFEEGCEDTVNTESLARHEREYIEWVLLQSEGNITDAARRLGIHRQSLQRKLRKFTPK